MKKNGGAEERRHKLKQHGPGILSCDHEKNSGKSSRCDEASRRSEGILRHSIEAFRGRKGNFPVFVRSDLFEKNFFPVDLHGAFPESGGG